MRRLVFLSLLCLAGVFVGPGVAQAHGSGAISLFPSDALTVRDAAQLTGRRVALPLPDCAKSPTDCDTVRQLNQLDGFDIDPRIAIGFGSPVDPVSVAAGTTVTPRDDRHAKPTGVDRVVYDPTSHTVYAHPAAQLAPDTTYELTAPGARTTFTTGSATTVLTDLRAQLDSGAAYRAAHIGADERGLSIDANVPVAGTTLSYTQDEGTAGGLVTVPVPSTSGTGAARYVFGSFLAPSWLDGDSVIPAVPTRGPGPAVRSRVRLPFVLIVPAGTPPPGGWPVAIFGHGFTGSDANVFLAGDFNASNGFATIGTDVVGHGYGARSTWNITTASGTVSVPAHARGSDRDGDGFVTSTEGVSAAVQPAADAAVNSRDGLTQTVADVMTLVRAIGHGLPSSARIALRGNGIDYYGQSFGGIYGTMLAGVDPRVDVLALNVAGGPISEIARLSPDFRPLVEQDLALRQPNLLNGGFDNFTESMPLRGQAPVLNPAPGAVAIQRVIAEETWLDRSGGPETYAPLLRDKRVLFQNAYGDQTVSNPTTYTLLAAGHLFGRDSLYRNDETPQAGINPHGFLLDPEFTLGNTQAQQQIVAFFTSSGTRVINPGLAWEVPIHDRNTLLSLNFSEPG
jgi:hypothetical protein